MENLRGRVAVVTGAASGIGRALAVRFAAEGMKLVLGDVEAGPLDLLRAELEGARAEVLALPVDVADEAQVGAFADAAFARFGAVHLLCNNAGVAAPALRVPAWETNDADWQWILAVNLMGVVHGLRAFVPRMLAGGDEGHVVNTASVAGLLGGSGPYHASKHAVVCLSEGLYKDLRGVGARVSASVLCPGLIRTAILDAERNRPAAFGPRTELARHSPDTQRWAAAFADALRAGYEPEVVAGAVVDAVRADRFYVVPAQPNLIDLIRLRLQDIAELRNPTPAPAG